MVISGLVNHGTKASLMASSLNYLWSTGTTFTPSPQLATLPWPPNSSQTTQDVHKCGWAFDSIAN